MYDVVKRTNMEHRGRSRYGLLSCALNFLWANLETEGWQEGCREMDEMPSSAMPSNDTVEEAGKSSWQTA
jgi:hypothetical protein